jgi:hypothetical protein
MAVKPKSQEKFGGKDGSGDISGSKNPFVCPECTAEHTFSGHKAGESLKFPKCAIPMKSKYVNQREWPPGLIGINP